MNKPKLSVKKYDVWGRPQFVRHFMNDSQLHQAWADYAIANRYNENLVIVTIFADGSSTQDNFCHVQKIVPYKDYDGEHWHVEIDTTKTKWAINDINDRFLKIESQSATKNQIITALRKFYKMQEWEVESITAEIQKL